MTRLLGRLVLSVLLLLLPEAALVTTAQVVIRVRYGYFAEARPFHAACARGWLDLDLGHTQYQVTCYPQTSGNFAASRLDNAQLDFAQLGSTPMAQAAARGIDVSVIYVSQYTGDSQGIYVRASLDTTPITTAPSTSTSNSTTIISNPFELRGKTIGVPFGSTMHYQVMFLLDLFGLTGDVNLVNMAPSQIIQAWDDGSIDAGACWGAAREYLLKFDGEGNPNLPPANTLMTAGVLADWGRPTFVVIAARRKFVRENPDFVTHFLAVVSRINDSFIDRLGEIGAQNSVRWDAQRPAGESLVPSMVDVLLKSSEIPHSPSQAYINLQRRVLDLFIQHTAQEQISCDYSGQVYSSLQQTTEFLLDQKEVGSLGQLSKDSKCGGDLIDATLLDRSQTACSNCYPVGPYAGSMANQGNLLEELERLDAESTKSPFASLEIGRVAGDSTCHITVDGRPHHQVLEISDVGVTFGDGANARNGKSYSENLNCTWEIRGGDRDIIELSLQTVRLWSGDFIRVYTDPNHQCKPFTNRLTLLAQISGFHDEPTNELPPIRATGCMLVQFETDANQERSYGDTLNQGDGFLARAEIVPLDCDCNTDLGFGCSGDGLCECGGQAWGGDCSRLDHCLGTNRIELYDGEAIVVASSGSLSPTDFEFNDPSSLPYIDPDMAYPNDLDCSFDFHVNLGSNNKYLIVVEVFYDLEATHDLLWLQTGIHSSETGIVPYVVLTNISASSGDPQEPEIYYVPTDDSDMASLRLTTDSRGRRRGFYARVRAMIAIDGSGICERGYSGSECEIPYCRSQNTLGTTDWLETSAKRNFVLGRVVSQSFNRHVRAMPWEGGCVWPLDDGGSALVGKVAIRLVFNLPLDLEPHPVSAVGDKLIIRTKERDTAFFIEQCSSDETCSFPWQTGVCGEGGGCTVRDSVDVYAKDFTGAQAILVTDRNDGGREYHGLDFEALVVEECPTEDGKTHCEAAAGGKCVKGSCICEGGIPCDCPCDGDKPGLFGNVKIGLVVGIVVPLFLIFFGVFLWYRRRKIFKSRAQKEIILAKEEELEAFRNSVVGMRSAIREYIPRVILDASMEMAAPFTGKVEVRPAPPKVQWCWRETDAFMSNHDVEKIVGDPADCWIKYDDESNASLEAAYQEQGGAGTFSPLPGYVVDFGDLIQTKMATRFQREVNRLIEYAAGAQPLEHKEIDLDNAQIGDPLPDELRGEPQMVLVTGDVVQISTQRQDGWAFGTKLHFRDEAMARELVRIASEGAAEDEANVFTDTGWFQLDATQVPSGEDLAVLQSNVGDTGALDPPDYWGEVADPTLVQLQTIKAGDPEREQVVDAFMATLTAPKFSKKVKVLKVERIQNLGMWQSYVVKRQTICYRERHLGGGDDSDDDDVTMKKALARFEKRWLWHGTNVEVKDKIMQQGFNRSFCGKNATMYGKGVYFARDTSYSVYPTYAVPDKDGSQYVMACRVVVGEYCQGHVDAVTPDIRDTATQALYDTTVGLLTGDTMSNPSIYVTYHDAQAYPEYLIKFKLSQFKLS